MPANDPSRRSWSRREFVRVVAASAAATALDWSRLRARAAEISPKSAYPVVVIGAGLGGLSVAALLARNGFPVTVLERREVPGGYAVSFQRGDFSFQVTPHFVLGLAPILEELGIADKVRLVSLPVGLHAVAPDLSLALPQADPAGVARVLTERFPAEAEGIRAYLDELKELLREWRTPVADPKSMAETHPLMWRLGAESLGRLLNRHSMDPQLWALLASFGSMYGMPPSRLPALSGAIGALAVIMAGRQYVRNDPSSLAESLVQVIEKSGGRVRYGAEVARILEKDGAAVGVRTSSGHQVEARAVVSNAPAPITFDRMLEPGVLPASYVERLRTYRRSVSTFQVWLGLRRELKGRIDGYGHLVMPAGLDWEAAQGTRAGDPSAAAIGVYVDDNADPGYSKPGKGSVRLLMMTPYAPWRRFEAEYLAGRKEAYRKEKERVAGILIDRAEKWLIPGLRSSVEVMEAASPLTNLRFTANPDGAILGYECSLENCGRTRIQNRTPVKVLYLASAWDDPGGGVNPVMRGASNVYKSLLEDWRRRGLDRPCVAAAVGSDAPPAA
jgi:phytoene dehydrogenase-like protein